VRECRELAVGLSAEHLPAALLEQLQRTAVAKAHLEHAAALDAALCDREVDLVAVVPARELHVRRGVVPGERLRCNGVIGAVCIERVERLDRRSRVLVHEAARAARLPFALRAVAVQGAVPGDVAVGIRHAQREELVGFAAQRAWHLGQHQSISWVSNAE
jgi:hypothetical protein